MAKPRIPNQKRQYLKLNHRLARYVALIQKIYNTLNSSAAKIVFRTDYSVTDNKPFLFADYPQTRNAIAKLQAQFVNDISSIIYRGTSAEWKESNLVQDLIVDKVFKSYKAQVNHQKYKIYYQTNSAHLKAFQQRKDRGMNLSTKLWDQSESYKKGLEAAISCAIKKGTSAVTLSKQISKYLNDFPQLQKDYKERYGHATDAHDCEYRSIRLARSEINMAYRTAEQTRWRQLNFVVGYEIKLSGSHPCHDICDELAGKYPKSFNWTGWHPNDLCYAIPILNTEDEFWENIESKETAQSINTVSDVPDGFKKWVKDNTMRISQAESRGTAPYFIRDNRAVVRTFIKK